MASTDNRNYTKMLSTVAPDVPYWVNTALEQIDADVQGVDQRIDTATADIEAEAVAAAKTYTDTTAGVIAARNVKAIAAASGENSRTNILINSGPKTDTPAWFVSWGTGGAGTRTVVDDAAMPSGKSLLHTWTTSATSYNAVIRAVAAPAQAGKLYAGSIWVRSSIANVIGAVGYFYDAAGALISSKFNRLYNIVPGQVTRLDIAGLLAPAGTATIRLGVGINSRGVAYTAGQTLAVSSAVVDEGTTPEQWFDGDSPNAYWTGEAGNSTSVLAVSSASFGAPFTLAPLAAGGRAGKFSPRRRVYLPAGADLGPIRRRIAQALTGSSRCRLAFIGHSIVAGQGGIPGTVDNPRLFQQRAAQSGQATTGIVTAVNGTTKDARITFDTEWENLGAPRANMQLHRRCLVAGKNFTYASDNAGTVVEIFTFGNGSAVTYSIDGGAPVTINPSGLSAIQVTTVTGLSNTKHTVTVTSTTATAAYLLGISVTQGAGLEVSNFGYSGSVAADWRSDYFTASQRFYNGYNDALTGWAADAVVIELGANELIWGSTAAALKTNLGDIVNSAQTAGKDVVIVLGTPVEDATRTTWFTEYYPAVYDVADTYSVPLIDLSAHWINRAVADAQGFYYDQWHPNAKGYYDLHAVFAGALL